MSRNYYEVLGIAKSASADEIKAAFRKLARQFHPDVNKEAGSDKKFKEINEAYQVLGDPQKKQQYDTYGRVGGAGSGGFNQDDIFSNFSGSGFGDLGDIFESFFGGAGRGQQRRPGAPERGSDLQLEMSISLEEAYFGKDQEVEITHLKACSPCKGSGAEPGTSSKKCEACKGMGQVSHAQRTVFGSFSQVVPCVACSGKGEVITSPCKTCRGAGRHRQNAKINVKIPAGIDNGYRLRITGEGDDGIKGGGRGDVYVFIKVAQDKRFKRQDDDLFILEKMDFVSATLGDEIDINLFDENVKVKIPAGTQPNTVLRQKGKGMPRLQGHGRGDLFVELQVEIPTRLSKKQIDLLKELKGIK